MVLDVKHTWIIFEMFLHFNWSPHIFLTDSHIVGHMVFITCLPFHWSLYRAVDECTWISYNIIAIIITFRVIFVNLLSIMLEWLAYTHNLVFKSWQTSYNKTCQDRSLLTHETHDQSIKSLSTIRVTTAHTLLFAMVWPKTNKQKHISKHWMQKLGKSTISPLEKEMTRKWSTWLNNIVLVNSGPNIVQQRLSSGVTQTHNRTGN